MDHVFDYVVEKKYVCEEHEYSYTARDGDCKQNKCSLDIGLKGKVNVKENS
jgi:nitrite reductase/ring-hydroxylating ferredoxin subunit